MTKTHIIEAIRGGTLCGITPLLGSVNVGVSGDYSAADSREVSRYHSTVCGRCMRMFVAKREAARNAEAQR